MRHSFYHTVSVERIDAALDDKGKVTGWRAPALLRPSIISTRSRRTTATSSRSSTAWASSIRRSTSQTCVARTARAMAHTRIGWFRSVSNVPRVFAVQSAVSELAHKLGRDPKDFLLQLIGPDRVGSIRRRSGSRPTSGTTVTPMRSFPIDTALASRTWCVWRRRRPAGGVSFRTPGLWDRGSLRLVELRGDGGPCGCRRGRHHPCARGGDGGGLRLLRQSRT